MDDSPASSPEYPAAHSMDTTWFGVDENGEVGAFDTGSDGDCPVFEAIAQPDPGSKTVDAQHSKEYPRYWEIPDEVCDALLGPEGPSRTRIPREALGQFFHAYEPPDSSRGPYYWRSSPASPMRYEDLPAIVRESIPFMKMEDVVFADREPVDPHDFAQRCFAWGEYDVRGATKDLQVPLPALEFSWTEDMRAHAGSIYGFQAFFAHDDEGELALFISDIRGHFPKGAMLLTIEESGHKRRPSPKNPSDVWPWTLELLAANGMFSCNNLAGECVPAAVFDRAKSAWTAREPILCLVNRVPAVERLIINEPFQVVSEGLLLLHRNWFGNAVPMLMQHGKVRRTWRRWLGHWCESPFLTMPPAAAGFWQYDHHWHHATPYSRTGVPFAPLRLADMPASWIERTRPVHLPSTRFGESLRVQPWGLVPCWCSTDLATDTDLRSIVGTHKDALIPDGPARERVLRRAVAWHDLIERRLFRDSGTA